jgi:hypothetical protein
MHKTQGICLGLLTHYLNKEALKNQLFITIQQSKQTLQITVSFITHPVLMQSLVKSKKLFDF